MDVYAWCGFDENGDYGLKMFVTPWGGASVATFATRRTAERPYVLAQMQALANALQQPMELKRFTDAETLRTFTPQPQG